MNPPVFTKLDEFKKDIRYIGRTLLMYVFIEVLMNILVFVLFRYVHIPLKNPVYQGMLICITSVISILPCILYSKKRLRVKWKKEEFEFNFSFIHVFNTVCSIYAMVFFVNGLLTVIKTILHINLVNSSLFQSTNPLDVFFCLFAAVIIAPILEELLCRGVLCRALARYSRFIAVIITGIVFGMMHMNFQQGLMHMITGAILAYVSLKYGSILMTICCHMLFNAIAAIMSYSVYFPKGLTIVLSIGVLAIVGYGLFVVCKEVGSIHNDTKYPYFRMAFKQVSLVLSIIVFVVISVLEIFVSSI